MEVNDDTGNLTPLGVLEFFASKLAPTRIGGGFKGEKKPRDRMGRGAKNLVG